MLKQAWDSHLCYICCVLVFTCNCLSSLIAALASLEHHQQQLRLLFQEARPSRHWSWSQCNDQSCHLASWNNQISQVVQFLSASPITEILVFVLQTWGMIRLSARITMNHWSERISVFATWVSCRFGKGYGLSKSAKIQAGFCIFQALMYVPDMLFKTYSTLCSLTSSSQFSDVGVVHTPGGCTKRAQVWHLVQPQKSS